MTARGHRPDRTPSVEQGQAELNDEARPLQVHLEIVTVGGQEGTRLRTAQAAIIRELLLWVGDEHTDEDTGAHTDARTTTTA